ncbi:MAG TPA: tetratricopeptide repeat protein [Terriglobales bacterium]|nr:tetratricopeptide repeat protein [Terriglobales bacterium]
MLLKPMGSAQASPTLVRFGLFEADLRAGELRRNGVKVRLQDLPFRALTLLLSRPGEVITREEFRQALWPPDVFVDFEQGISSAVMRLRDALRDAAENPIFIQTIERRGYRWIGPLHPPEGTAPLPPEEESVTVAAPTDARSVHWRKAVFGLPVLLLLLVAAWRFWPAHRYSRYVRGATTARSTAHREAEEFYLKGRFYWDKRTPESLNQAVDAFTQAIVHDPNYSDAYVGLADCYNLLREFSAMPENEAYSRAYAAAKKAVELGPQSSEAHASLAFVTFWGMWDAAGAEKEFRRALELDPNNAKAHHWYATALQALNREDEGLAEIGIARRLDPGSASILADQGELLLSSGHVDEAAKLLRQLEAAQPDFISAHRYLRFLYFSQEDWPSFLTEWKKEALLTHDQAMLAEVGTATQGFAQGGKQKMFQALLSEQEELYKQGKVNAYCVAVSANQLGDRDNTLKYLRLAIQAHDSMAVVLAHDPNFASLDGDPAFTRLVARVGPSR